MKEIRDKQKSSIKSPKANCALNPRKEIADYVSCIFEPKDIVEVRQLPYGKSGWHLADELVGITDFLSLDNRRKQQQIYVGVNPRSVKGGTRGKHVACARCLFVDFDRITINETEQKWCSAGLPTPTIVIESGHGIHAYWRLSEPVTDLDLWSKLQKRLITLLKSDATIHDPARIMRLPGFINHKKPAALCQIIDCDTRRTYDLNSLIALLHSVITESDYTTQYLEACKRALPQNKPFLNNINAIQLARRIAAKWDGVVKGGRNNEAFQNAAFLLKNLRLPIEKAWPILQQWNRKNSPPLPERELWQTINNAHIYGRHFVKDNTFK
jgi:hypothetical protein